MSKAIYSKLAVTNLKNNRSTYLPYLLTSICTIITYYTMQSISLNPGLDNIIGAETLKSILLLGTIIIGLFSIVLLFYTNSFLIKRRKKELGLYTILGMEKRHIAKVLFIETIMIALISLVLGLLGGILISKLLFLVLLKILNFSIGIQFYISIPSIWSTIVIFGFIFLITLITNFVHIQQTNPIELLKGSQHGEREPKSSKLLTLIGVLALGGGYGIAIFVKSPTEALMLFFVAVTLVIIGTYTLFTSGSIALLKLLKKRKGFYYNPKNFISVSGMIYRMKQNAVGLANICILSTMVLVTISATVSLYMGKEEMLRTRNPYDISIKVENTPENIQAIQHTIEQQAAAHQVTPVDTISVHTLSYNIYEQDNGIWATSPPDESTGLILEPAFVTMIPVEDYNRMSGANETLEDNQILLFQNSGDYGKETMQIGDTIYQVQKEIQEINLAKKENHSSIKSFYLVLKDIDAIQTSLGNVHQARSKFVYYEMDFNLQGTEDDILAFASGLRDESFAKVEHIYMESLHLNKQSWYGTFGGFLFLGIFLGALFMMATVLIIYYKQISEGYDDHDRFTIMQKVGMSRQEVKKTIRKQILMVFFLPLCTAVVHITVAFGVISKLLLMFSLSNTTLFLICTICTVLLFGAIYALVYALTAKTYYKLVQQNERQ